MYLNGVNGENFVYYDGYYNNEKNGFFGQWYFNEPDEDGEENFFIKFTKDEWYLYIYRLFTEAVLC